MTIVLCILWPKLMQCMGDLLIFVSTKRMYFCPAFFLDNCYTDRNQLLEKIKSYIGF